MSIVISSDNIFSDIINVKDKSGICHHLANEEKYLEEEIIWVIDDE